LAAWREIGFLRAKRTYLAPSRNVYPKMPWLPFTSLVNLDPECGFHRLFARLVICRIRSILAAGYWLFAAKE
jgi:hypothetical protein